MDLQETRKIAGVAEVAEVATAATVVTGVDAADSKSHDVQLPRLEPNLRQGRRQREACPPW